jgi:error-prone DNA polymerase
MGQADLVERGEVAELRIFGADDLPGYFLIVSDIVMFCRRSDILCPGQGSTANSAVCYAVSTANLILTGSASR